MYTEQFHNFNNSMYTEKFYNFNKSMYTEKFYNFNKSMYTELGTFKWWTTGLMLDPLFFLISRLNNACSPHFINLQISFTDQD